MKNSTATYYVAIARISHRCISARIRRRIAGKLLHAVNVLSPELLGEYEKIVVERYWQNFCAEVGPLLRYPDGSEN